MIDACKPETLDQAKYFDRLVLAYEEAGICNKCAAQAAFGHQIGFTLSNPPCVLCLGRVSKFPVEAANGWRKLEGRVGR